MEVLGEDYALYQLFGYLYLLLCLSNDNENYLFSIVGSIMP